MVDFAPLEALSGPGSPDPDFTQSYVTSKHEILNISLHICNIMTFATNADPESVDTCKQTEPTLRTRSKRKFTKTPNLIFVTRLAHLDVFTLGIVNINLYV